METNQPTSRPATDHDIMAICDSLQNGNLTDAGVAMRDAHEPHRVTLAVVARLVTFDGIDAAEALSGVGRSFNAADRNA